MTCEVLMRHPDINLNCMSANGWTALHRAAQSGHAGAIVYSSFDGAAMRIARDLAAQGGLVRKVQAIDESRPARPYPVERATRDATTWRAVDIAGELSGEPLGAR